MPAPVQQPGREQAQGNRQHQNDGGIDLGEAVDKALGGGLGGLRLLHGMDDARNQAVAGRCSYTQVQLAVLVDGACIQLVARAFVRQRALARDGGLVDRAFALGDQAVEWDASAWRHTQHGA